jgi:predicted nucleic acid-binding protein
MIVVCDMGPIHYLVLIGAEDILPHLFTRVLTPVAVIAEMSHPDTPEPVRRWALAPPQWLEIKEPAHIEDIAALGRKGMRGAGEKAAIALAREERADAILMDDKTGQREAKKRGLHPVWMLSVLDEAAERGLVSDLPEKLDHLVQKTRFYVSKECKQVIESMRQHDMQRKLAESPPEQKDEPSSSEGV